jgi:hypothetical protein
VSTVDIDRIQRARERLRSAIDSPRRGDPAIRLVELHSPLPGDEALQFHRNFCVISELSERGRQALSATIDGLRLNDPTNGLAGTIETRGRRASLTHVRTEQQSPGTALVPSRAFFPGASARTARAAQLAEVIEMIARAVLLSGAELRGADAAAEEIRRSVVPPRTEIMIPDQHVDDARRTLQALEEVAPSREIVAELASAAEALDGDRARVALEAKRSQAQAAKAQLLPTTGRDVVMMADLAVAEADGEIAEYDMIPGSTAGQLAAYLALLDIETSPAAAPALAQRVLKEATELESIRVRTLETIDAEAAKRGPNGHGAGPHVELQHIDDQRHHIQRRLRSQQQLLAVAREQWARAGIGDLDLRSHLELTRDSERPLPILVEEPLADLPARLSGGILSTLLRHSAQTQVICVSDQVDLRSWCTSVGDRADWVAASGWFAGGDD